MKLLNLKIRAVQGCKEVDLRAIDDNLILVGGKNGQGKTSLLNAVRMALMGKRDFPWPEKIIHEDANRAEVEITLSGDPSLAEDRELKVVLEIDRKRGGEVDTINIFDSAGEKAPSPRSLLKELYQTIAFDPLEFERMPAKKQRELIAELVGVDLDRPREEYQTLYDERKLVNREITSLTVKEDELHWHEDLPASEVDTKELVAAVESNGLLRVKFRELEGGYSKAQAAAGELAAIMEHGTQRIRQLTSDLGEAEAMLLVNAEQLKTLGHEIKELENKKHQLGDAPDDTDLLKQIATAGDVNEQIRHNARNQLLVKDRIDRKKESDGLTESMQAITEKVEQSLWKAKFPVEGMSLDKEGVLLNGRPFSSCSRSERIQSSARVGMAMNPKLRLLICEDGSDLDQDALDELDKVLKEHDFQALIEIVCRGKEDEGRCKVVMENGEAK